MVDPWKIYKERNAMIDPKEVSYRLMGVRCRDCKEFEDMVGNGRYGKCKILNLPASGGSRCWRCADFQMRCGKISDGESGQ